MDKGIESGWHCLDPGCGPRGATQLFSDRVGDSGCVVGLEYNPEYVSIARHEAPANVEIVAGDAYTIGFPDSQFDLVHMRFLASTAGETERLVKPSGYLVMQETDGSTLACSGQVLSGENLCRQFVHQRPGCLPL